MIVTVRLGAKKPGLSPERIPAKIQLCSEATLCCVDATFS